MEKRFIPLILLLIILILPFTANSQTQSKKISFSIVAPLMTSVVYYQGHYVIPYINFTGVVGNTSKSFFISLKSESFINYSGKVFRLPFGITSVSGGVVNGEVVLFALGTSLNITLYNVSVFALFSLFQLLSLFKNVSLYLITFNGKTYNVSLIAPNVSYLQLISNGVYTYAIGNNTITTIYNGKIGSVVNLKIKNLTHITPLALGKDVVSLEGKVNGSEEEVLIINTTNGEILKNITNFINATPVMNSSNSEFTILYNNDSIIVYNYLGEQIESINIGIIPNIRDVELFSNSTLLVSSISAMVGTLLPSVTFYTYVNIQGKWLKYTTYQVPIRSIYQIKIPIGILVYPSYYKIAFVTMTSSISSGNVSFTVSVTPSFMTIPFTKPSPPQLEVYTIEGTGSSTIVISALYPNSTLIGVYNVTFLVNGSFVGVYNFGENAYYAVKSSGIYNVTAIVFNAFGYTTVSKLVNVTVQQPVTITTTTTPPTTTSTTQTETTTTTSTISPSTTSMTTTSVTTSTSTKPQGFPTLPIIAGVIVVILVIGIFILLRRK
jgi:hypothetical protein